jgi:DNA-binding transcriptional LysR family regulator
VAQESLLASLGRTLPRAGGSIFERDHANVVLTEAGRVFVEEAKLCLLHDERAVGVAKAVSEGVESVLTIGRSPYADPFLTSALLSIHLPLYPILHAKAIFM